MLRLARKNICVLNQEKSPVTFHCGQKLRFLHCALCHLGLKWSKEESRIWSQLRSLLSSAGIVGGGGGETVSTEGMSHTEKDTLQRTWSAPNSAGCLCFSPDSWMVDWNSCQNVRQRESFLVGWNFLIRISSVIILVVHMKPVLWNQAGLGMTFTFVDMALWCNKAQEKIDPGSRAKNNVLIVSCQKGDGHKPGSRVTIRRLYWAWCRH